MKFFFATIGIIGAGFLGYVLEPDLRFSLTGQTPKTPAPPVAVTIPAATPAPAPTAPVAEPTPPVVATNEPTTPAVQPMPEKKEEVAVQPTPEPAPTPTPTPTPTPAAGSLSAEDIVKLMQESIRSGQIKEFTFDQVIGWKAGEDEELDGEKYQTGLAAYKAETIFGVKNIQAKAMIQGGKVIRWIWPTSGLEIQ